MSAFSLKSLRFNILLLPFFALVLSGCETNLATDELRIVTSRLLPKRMTYYKQIDVPIEIAGGDGVYTVRYIQNPDDTIPEDLVLIDDGNNPVELSVIREENTQKNTFRLQGLVFPTEDIGEVSSTYWIEYSDGNTTKYERVDFEVSLPLINTGEFFSKDTVEGETDTVEFDRIIKSRNPLCDEAYDYQPEPIDTPYGRAYPKSLLLGLSQLVDVPVRFSYAIKEGGGSSSSDSAVEYSDFIPVDGMFELKPGQLGCPIHVFILDDNEIEGVEKVAVEISSIEGILYDGNAELSSTLSIEDNDAFLLRENLEYTVNVGEFLSIPFNIALPGVRDTFFPVHVNGNTTLPAESYTFTPESQLVDVAEGETRGVLGVIVNSVPSSLASKPVIELETRRGSDVVSTITISVNTWTATDAISVPNEEYVALKDQDGLTFVLGTLVVNGDQSFVVRVFDETGSPVQVNGSDRFVYNVPGVDLVAQALHLNLASDVGYFSVLGEVDGNFAGQQWGGKDLFSIAFQLDGSNINELQRAQFGSELDDTFLLSNFSGEEGVISGYSNGVSLDGSSIVPSNGGSEGFVYSGIINTTETNLVGQFVGTFGDDQAYGADLDSNIVRVVVGSTEGSFLRSLDRAGGEDLDYEDYSFNFNRPVTVSDVRSVEGDIVAALMTSDQALPGLSLVSSLSDDVFFYEVNLDNNSVRTVSAISTSEDEVGVGFSILESNDKTMVGVVGHTLGAFEGQRRIAAAENLNDGFLATFELGTGSEVTVTQFGTPGDDYVIDVEAVNEEKFLVLWKENHTSGDGTFRYRITPFAPDGTNLAPLF